LHRIAKQVNEASLSPIVPFRVIVSGIWLLDHNHNALTITGSRPQRADDHRRLISAVVGVGTHAFGSDPRP
jgi:hypothetical protein